MVSRPWKARASRSRSTTIRLPKVGVGVLTVGMALAGCGGDSLLLPGNGEPAHISAFKGDGQIGTVGQPLGDSLVAQVTDPSGRPVEGVEVVFTGPDGSTFEPFDRDTTGANGQAAVHYTLSTTAGSQQVQASAPIQPEANATVVFSLTANPENAATLVRDAGDGQSAQVGTILPESLSVRAVDRFNNGVPGVEVTWQATGGGEVNPKTVVTGADGRAKTSRTLGSEPGAYPAAARAQGLEGSPVSFTALAMAAPRPALALLTQPSTTASAGVPLNEQPVLQLQDPFGAPLTEEDVRVTVQIAEGDGSLGGHTTVRSDANGGVRFTDLEFRGETGPKTLIFAADGFTPVTSATIVVLPGPPDGSQSSVSVPNGTAGASTPITLRLRDEFGNPIPDALGDLSVSIAGANPTSSVPLSDNGNGSYAGSYVPVHSGTDVVTVSFRGNRIGGEQPSVVAPGPTDAGASTAVLTRVGALFVQVDVLVTARDALGNPVGHGGDQVLISPNGGPPRTAVDNGDGTYADRFIIVANEVSVAITLNGVPLAGSPFTPTPVD